MGPDPISEGVRAARPGAAADGHGSRTRGSFELLERDHVLFGPWSLPGRPAGGGALFRSGGECDLASSHLTFSRISRPLSILTRASRGPCSFPTWGFHRIWIMDLGVVEAGPPNLGTENQATVPLHDS